MIDTLLFTHNAKIKKAKNHVARKRASNFFRKKLNFSQLADFFSL
jgi:hypothetical protein